MAYADKDWKYVGASEVVLDGISKKSRTQQIDQRIRAERSLGQIAWAPVSLDPPSEVTSDAGFQVKYVGSDGLQPLATVLKKRNLCSKISCCIIF